MDAEPPDAMVLPMSTLVAAESAGDLLREWRQRRRLSQLDLALDAEVSTRHLSFVETGRSAPSREMLLRLAERLDMPLRARNRLLNAAGFAGVYPERALDSPDLSAARKAVDLVLGAHRPFPALAVDRGWNLVAANESAQALMTGVAAELLASPINVLRLSLHPKGLAPRIDNLGEWRAHLLNRLQQQIERSGDPELQALRRELSGYPGADAVASRHDPLGVVTPLRLRVDWASEPLSMISTTTVFGTPVDVTLSELALECFFPADERTRRALEQAGSACT